MFTGLVETFGAVTSVKNTGNSVRLAVKSLSEFDVSLGDSVSVNGVCLTVTKHNGDISFDVSPETLRSTNLGNLKTGDKINLERALRLSDRLGGHLVTGHVDGIGTIKNKKQVGEYTFYTFEAPAEILKYIVKKGSVAIDGISLTVVDLDHGSFSVAIIPHTASATNIGGKGIGDRVNLEADIIGKYVEKLLGKNDTDSNLMGLLKEKGFINE
ncbi:MAG: riboflavin synthase [Nitrospirae bacterium]|nr:riboflavin synthase [Nitrospirota bacterium]